MAGLVNLMSSSQSIQVGWPLTGCTLLATTFLATECALDNYKLVTVALTWPMWLKAEEKNNSF